MTLRDHQDTLHALVTKALDNCIDFAREYEADDHQVQSFELMVFQRWLTTSNGETWLNLQIDGVPDSQQIWL